MDSSGPYLLNFEILGGQGSDPILLLFCCPGLYTDLLPGLVNIQKAIENGHMDL